MLYQFPTPQVPLRAYRCRAQRCAACSSAHHVRCRAAQVSADQSIKMSSTEACHTQQCAPCEISMQSRAGECRPQHEDVEHRVAHRARCRAVQVGAAQRMKMSSPEMRHTQLCAPCVHRVGQYPCSMMLSQVRGSQQMIAAITMQHCLAGWISTNHEPDGAQAQMPHNDDVRHSVRGSVQKHSGHPAHASSLTSQPPQAFLASPKSAACELAYTVCHICPCEIFCTQL